MVATSLLATSLLSVAFAAPYPRGAQAATPQGIGDGRSGDLGPEEQAEADDLAEATIKRACLTCHPVENVVRVRRDVADWNAVVTRMAALGAPATPDEFRMIRRYLIRYYGTIRVNSASTEEFSAVLGYSPKDAAAIVAHRQAHGRFADVDALAKVPGLDRSKLDAQPEALQFD